MLIGFDETGTVVAGERFIVAVALIRPSSLPTLTSHLTRWENLSRRRIPGRPVEVKASNLDDEARRSFVNKVLVPPNNGVFYYGVGVDVDAHVVAWGERQRDHFIETLTDAVAAARDDGRNKWANQVTTMTGWLRKTGGGMMVKMTVLNMAIAQSLNQAIGTSVAGRFDHELGDLRYHIDEGFIRGGPNFWKVVLGSHLMQSTQSEPTIQIDSWPDDHPFLSTFVDRNLGDYRRLSQEFKRRFEFRDSRDSVVVRAADIIAGLLRRRHVAGEHAHYLDRMKERSLEPEMTVLQFSDLDAFEQPSAEGFKNLYDEVARLEASIIAESTANGQVRA